MPDRRSMSPESASRAHRRRDLQDLGRYQAIADAAKMRRVEQKNEDLEKEEAANTQALRLQSLADQHEEVLRKKEDEHRVIVDMLKNGHSKSVQDLKREAQAAEEALQGEVARLKKEARKQQTAKDEADEEIDELKRRISKLQATHKTELETKEEAHRTEKERVIRAVKADFEPLLVELQSFRNRGSQRQLTAPPAPTAPSSSASASADRLLIAAMRVRQQLTGKLFEVITMANKYKVSAAGETDASIRPLLMCSSEAYQTLADTMAPMLAVDPEEWKTEELRGYAQELEHAWAAAEKRAKIKVDTLEELKESWLKKAREENLGPNYLIDWYRSRFSDA